MIGHTHSLAGCEKSHSHPRSTQAATANAPRRGSVMVMALVCMAVSMMLALAMLRTAGLTRRALRTERDLRQVECLLAAAADLGQRRLAAGTLIDDVILLPPADLTGSARITLTPAAATGASLQIIVEYPLEGPLTIRRSRTIMPAAVPSSPVAPVTSVAPRSSATPAQESLP